MGCKVAKFIIITDEGEILRTINLPYEGNLIDISDMSDDEWKGWYNRLHEVKIKMKSKGVYEKDEHGLPQIVKIEERR